VGTMSPPEEGVDEAEIYIEGTRKMVDGFIRWCRKGDVGLSQFTKVTEVLEEEPTGLYDDFYVKTK
jgi:acylphosphatase